jgi:hypothetical protein
MLDFARQPGINSFQARGITMRQLHRPKAFTAKHTFGCGLGEREIASERSNVFGGLPHALCSPVFTRYQLMTENARVVPGSYIART